MLIPHTHKTAAEVMAAETEVVMEVETAGEMAVQVQEVMVVMVPLVMEMVTQGAVVVAAAERVTRAVVRVIQEALLIAALLQVV